jgi:ferredoxin-NADP reductase
VVFVHAARSARDLIFRDELEELARRHPGLRLAIFLEDAGSLGGRLDPNKLRAAVPDLEERETFLCGPAGMMDALSPIWSSNALASSPFMAAEWESATRAAVGSARASSKTS